MKPDFLASIEHLSSHEVETKRKTFLLTKLKEANTLALLKPIIKILIIRAFK